MDNVTGDGDWGRRIIALRAELAKGKLVSFFRTSDHLASLVSVAVQREVPPIAASGPPDPSIANEFTVFAPPKAVFGDSILVQLFAHTPQQTDEVIQLAREFDESAELLGFSSLGSEIPRGDELQVELAHTGFEIDESVQSFVWRGRPVSVQFAVTVPHAQTPGKPIGKATIHWRGMPIGLISFNPLVSSSEVSPTIDVTPTVEGPRRYQKVYLCYASKDLNEVMKRVHMLDRLHVGVFQDLLGLEPGERWTPSSTNTSTSVMFSCCSGPRRPNSRSGSPRRFSTPWLEGGR